MSKTIAVLSTLNTKHREARYVTKRLESLGCNVLLIDMSTRGGAELLAHVPCERVMAEAGHDAQSLWRLQKHEIIKTMGEGLAKTVLKLYNENAFQGVLALGGLQNAIMACAAMQTLPLGVPKMIVSSAACGQRVFETFVGLKDVTVMSAVVDFSGPNPITDAILNNAAAAIAGMAERAEPVLNEGYPLIGLTSMGATDGVSGVIKLLARHGYQVAGFHATGAGGRAMEQCMESGMFRGVLDLTLHEIVNAEIFHAGLSDGAPGRLNAAAKAGLPMVVAPGGVDFVDFYRDAFFGGVIGDPNARKYILHNEQVAHVKLFENEIVRAAQIIAPRLNAASGPVTVLMPLKGFRFNAHYGEPMHDPKVDLAFAGALKEGLNPRIKYVEIDASINDAAFAQAAVDELLLLFQ